MRSPLVRLVIGPVLVLSIAIFAGAVAQAISQSDTAYFDGFQDLTGLDPARTSDKLVLDALGGVRLKTIGTPKAETWTSKADFTTPTTSGTESRLLVGTQTLDGTTTAGTLKLLWAPLAFRRSQPQPVLQPAAPASVDGFGVGGMCVQRLQDGTYSMWYTGIPENEYARRIYLATSPDGLNWTRYVAPGATGPAPVIDLGAPGSFDSRQIGKPSVIYDPADLAAPFRMWYAGEGDLGGSIGYATSPDGKVWTKYVAPGATGPTPVLQPGKVGTADSYRVTDPCVLYANGIYFMWYTADDSNNRRVAYATSVDGITWQRGGVVFDVGVGNYSEGAFAPAVVRTGLDTPDPADDRFHMIFTGNKVVGNGIQSKLINADSADGTSWSAGNIAFSAAGGDTAFDGYNVTQPAILYDPADATHPYKMWYVGNNPDANGNYHDRVGLAYQKQPGSVTQWVKAAGPLGAPYYESWLTLGTQGSAFDSMKVADLRIAAMPAPATGTYGLYTGTNAADFTQRIGVMQSADAGLTWSDANGHNTLIGAGPVAAFDEGGVACPAPFPKTGGGWYVLHTSFDVSGVPRIGLHTVSPDLTTVVRTAAPVLVSAGAYDAAGQADPFAVQDEPGQPLHVFYAGKDTQGAWSIGTAVSASGDPLSLSGAQQVLAPTAGSYDAGGLRKPVVHKVGDSWRMLYSAIDAQGVSRIACATSSDGHTWTRQGLILTTSTAAYDFAEAGVEPSWASWDGTTETLFFTGTDRFGWTRVGKAAATGAGYMDGGANTYELDNPTARDWRRLVWNPKTASPAGTSEEVWVSYFPTYSGDWSNFFPMTNDTDLPFLLTVQNMRWQVRMAVTDAADTSSTPQLDDLTVSHAPLVFPAKAVAWTLPIGPPEGLYVTTWGDLTVTADVPGNTGLTVAMEDDAGAQVVAPQPVTGSGLTSSLTGLAPLGGKLVAVFTFTSDGNATPKLKGLSVGYTSVSTPAQMSLVADKTTVVYGGSATLSGRLISDPTPLLPDSGDETPLAGQTVTIRKHVAGTTGYVVVTTPTPIVTDANGAFTLGVKPTAITTYRAEWAGGTVGTTVYPPASAGATVQVKPQVSVAVTRYNSRAGKYFRYKLGRTIYVKGAVTPNHAKFGDGTTGKVVVSFYRSTSSGWKKVKSSTRTLTTSSTYTWSWKPSARGTYRVVTSFPGDVDHLATKSAYKYVKVY